MDWARINNPTEWMFTTPIPQLNIWPQINKNSSILDIGCGYGRTLETLYRDGFINLYGIDISPSFINQAKLNCPNAKLYVGDCKDFDLYFHQKFDVVLVMGVLEYVISDQDQIDIVKKIKNILSPNGIAIFETFTMDIKSNFKQYLQGFLNKFHWGVFKNSKGFLCHHQTVSKLNYVFNSIFPFVIYEKKKFFSWTNNRINGMTIIASNNELRKI